MKNSRKTYQENSYLTSLCADVVKCEKANDHYQIVLDKTIFYPHLSGGQPKDEGFLDNLKVINVFEKGDEIIHVTEKRAEGKVNLSIDFSVRFDHMQQHTGQHILSHAFAKLYGGKTVGFHLSKDFTTIDIEIEMTKEQIKNSEIYANQIIYQNSNIFFHNLNYEEAIKLNLRKAPPKLDNLRIMEIEEVEYSACGGTHVKSTGEVGIIKIIKSEKHKSGTRLYFLCGKRALIDYYEKSNKLDQISNLMTCGNDFIFDNIEKLKAENKNLKRKISLIQDSLNVIYAEKLKNNPVIKNEIKYFFHVYENMEMKDLKFICSKLAEEENAVSVLLSENESTSIICLSQSKNLNFDLKALFEKLKAVINAKGGGSNYLLQGTGDKLKSHECMMLSKEFLL